VEVGGVVEDFVTERERTGNTNYLLPQQHNEA